jgi:hypothetical protein
MNARTNFVGWVAAGLSALVIVGCSDSTQGGAPNAPDGSLDASNESAADQSADSPSEAAGDADLDSDGAVDGSSDAPNDGLDGATCPCTPISGGGNETSLHCYCDLPLRCLDYSALVNQLCNQPNFVNIIESTYAACNLKSVQFYFGLASEVSFFDSTSGAFVGGMAADDLPSSTCPATSQNSGFRLAAGTYTPPCERTSEHVLCGSCDSAPCDDGGSDATGDGGPDAMGDGVDGSPDSAPVDATDN